MRLIAVMALPGASLWLLGVLLVAVVLLTAPCTAARAALLPDMAHQEAAFFRSFTTGFRSRRRPHRSRPRPYNRLRRHFAIGMISPVRFEELHTQTAQAA